MNSKKLIKKRIIEQDWSKIPPQAIDLECAILGAMILDWDSNDLCRQVATWLKPEMFYKEANQLVMEAILQQDASDFPVELLSITDRLKHNGTLEQVGGGYYLTTLIDKIVSSDNIDYHARIVYQKYLQREIIRICHEHQRIAFEDTADIFDLIESITKAIECLDPSVSEASTISTNHLIDNMQKDFLETEKQLSRGNLPILTYDTGWKRFDEFVTIGRDKVILIAGPPKSGKSRLVRTIARHLLKSYADISILWVTLEDSREDILRSYISTETFISNKKIKNCKYPKSMIPVFIEVTEKFRAYDIEFIDQAIKSSQIVNLFKRFCNRRKDRFNILIVDNVISLDDKEDFKHDPNGRDDYVMQNILKCRQKTKGLIFVLHHLNKDQGDKENVKTGYRPVKSDMKGSEAFSRVPNQVLLVNSFKIYPDLMAQYPPEDKEILSNLFIIDVQANRDDKIGDEVSLLHYFSEMEFDLFYEIEIPDIPLEETETFSKIDPHSIPF